MGWSRDALHYYYNFPTSSSKPNAVILYAACARRNSSAPGGLSGCCVPGAKTGRTECAGVGEAGWAMLFLDMGLGSDPFGTHSSQSTSRFSTRVKNLEVLWLLWTEKESWPAWIFHPKLSGNGGKRRSAPVYTEEVYYMIRLPLQNRGQSRSSLSAVLPLSWSSRRACFSGMV